MIRPALKILAIVLSILLCGVFAALFVRLRKYGWRDKAAITCARAVLFFSGVRVTASGRQADARPLLMVSNHLSYMDVPVLASLSNVRFTPKIEIKSWPFFGWLCGLQGSIFVDRKPEKIKEVSGTLKAALAAGEAMCIFPEATTGNGLQLLPFKSSFFSLAEEQIGEATVKVQPVALAYKRIRNLPISMTQWPEVAWYGDMTLLPHLWNFLKQSPVTVHVTYLTPVTMEEFGDRKALATYCHQVISAAIKEEN